MNKNVKLYVIGLMMMILVNWVHDLSLVAPPLSSCPHATDAVNLRLYLTVEYDHIQGLGTVVPTHLGGWHHVEGKKNLNMI